MESAPPAVDYSLGSEHEQRAELEYDEALDYQTESSALQVETELPAAKELEYEVPMTHDIETPEETTTSEQDPEPEYDEPANYESQHEIQESQDELYEIPDDRISHAYQSEEEETAITTSSSPSADQITAEGQRLDTLPSEVEDRTGELEREEPEESPYEIPVSHEDIEELEASQPEHNQMDVSYDEPDTEDLDQLPTETAIEEAVYEEVNLATESSPHLIEDEPVDESEELEVVTPLVEEASPEDQSGRCIGKLGFSFVSRGQTKAQIASRYFQIHYWFW